jgi:hypothetical protein
MKDKSIRGEDGTQSLPFQPAVDTERDAIGVSTSELRSSKIVVVRLRTFKG